MGASSACRKGKHQLIKPLLSAGAKGLEVHRGSLREVEARASGLPSAAGAGWTLLALASAHGHTACVCELLAAGADINAVSPARQLTPIQFAVRAGHAEVVEVLDHAARNRIKLGGLGRSQASLRELCGTSLRLSPEKWTGPPLSPVRSWQAFLAFRLLAPACSAVHRAPQSFALYFQQ